MNNISKMKHFVFSFFLIFVFFHFSNAQSNEATQIYTDFDFFTGTFKNQVIVQPKKKGVYYFVSKNDSNCLKVFRKNTLEKKELIDNVKTFCFDKGNHSFTSNNNKIKFLVYRDSGLVYENKIYRTRIGYYYGRDIYNKENTIFEILDSINVKIIKQVYEKGGDSFTNKSTLQNFKDWSMNTDTPRKITFYYSNLKGFWELGYCEGISKEECEQYKQNQIFRKTPPSLFWLVALL